MTPFGAPCDPLRTPALFVRLLVAEPATCPRRDPRGANAWVRSCVPCRLIGLADGARLGIVLTTAGDRL